MLCRKNCRICAFCQPPSSQFLHLQHRLLRRRRKILTMELLAMDAMQKMVAKCRTLWEYASNAYHVRITICARIVTQKASTHITGTYFFDWTIRIHILQVKFWIWRKYTKIYEIKRCKFKGVVSAFLCYVQKRAAEDHPIEEERDAFLRHLLRSGYIHNLLQRVAVKVIFIWNLNFYAKNYYSQTSWNLTPSQNLNLNRLNKRWSDKCWWWDEQRTYSIHPFCVFTHLSALHSNLSLCMQWLKTVLIV